MSGEKWQSVGRELDPELVRLEGAGAALRNRREEPTCGTAIWVWEELPSEPKAHEVDYYRLPLVKEPVWIWSVPLYFYLGGVAGGSAVLAALLHGSRGLRTLARYCRELAFLGTTVGASLLTWDLGRRLRFLNMLRVFRPTSPMSIGSWSLAGSGALATLTLVLGENPAGKVPAVALGGGGLILAGYTGVLLGNSANPLWSETRRSLPFLFGASSMASTAGLLQLLPLSAAEQAVVQRFGTIGKAAEVVALVAVEREAGRNPEAARGHHEGKAGLLWQGAKVLLVAGIVLELVPGRSSWKRRLGGAVTTLGAICLRFAVLESGKKAASEPRAVTAVQRRRGR